MSLLSSGRLYKQYCIYWEPKGNDDAGQPVYYDPRVIKCRWEDRAQEFLSKGGQTLISRSIVFVPEDLKDDSYLWLSPLTLPSRTTTEAEMAVLVLADLTARVINQEDGTDIYMPHRVIDAWQTRHRDTIPDLKNRNKLRIVIL